jgi:GDP-4-dehydro-6-deoxy-D-mannose reductase
MRSLVTGADGFLGGWLARSLVDRGDETFGLSRRERLPSTAGWKRVQGDVRDVAGLRTIVRDVAPDRIFHLAGWSHIPSSFVHPEDTFVTNTLGTLHLLEAVREHASGSIVVSVGSSAEYGESARDNPNVAEDAPLCPTSPYGISKVAQGLLCRQFSKTYGIKAIHVRPFAVIGPGKTGDALTQFAEQVVRVELGERSRVDVGDLEPVRDFIDVRDAVAALVQIAESGGGGEAYNLCNGDPVKLAELVDTLRACARVPFEVAVDTTRLRAVDDLRIVGDPARLHGLGYARRHSLAETVKATLDALRASTRAPTPS